MTLNEARKRAIVNSRGGCVVFVVARATYDKENDTYIIEKDGYNFSEWVDSAVVERYHNGVKD